MLVFPKSPSAHPPADADFLRYARHIRITWPFAPVAGRDRD
jgi:hypothetical protein